MKKIAVLPIRSGSKRIPQKNFVEFCGIPLYSCVLAEIYTSRLFDRVILAVDSTDHLPKTLLNDRDVTIHIRSAKNASDTASSESVLLEISEHFGINDSDFLFLFQATNPFLRQDYIKSAVNDVETKPIDSVISKVESRRFKIDEVLAEDFQRELTQDKTHTDLETGNLWAVKCSVLKKLHRRTGLNPSVININENDDFDIDTQSDLTFISEHLSNHIATNTNIHSALTNWFPLETKLLTNQFETREAMRRTFNRSTIESIRKITDNIKAALNNGGKIVLFGNGGSAADSQHIAAEFISKLQTDRIPLPAIALTTDTSALTAIGNDYGFEYLFERQVNALVSSQDVVIGITTSGKSVNVINGLQAAKNIGAYTIAMTGEDTPQIDAASIILASASKKTKVIQEIHIQLGHLICQISEENYVRR